MTTTAQLLLAWDQRRARSQQTELGMSEVGGCRRRAGYRLAGVAPTNSGGSIQAVLGTAIHTVVETVFRDLQDAGLIPAEDLVEHEVRFAGVKGHLDRYDSLRAEVDDTKSVAGRRLDHIRANGPDRQHVWQSHLYAAALVKEGRPVRSIVIDYIARDTGEDHQEYLPFDTQHVRDALDWLKYVRETPLELLPRDHAPSSAFCGGCPFRDLCWSGGIPGRDPRSVLYVDDPNGQEWARKLDEARADKADAARREDEAKGALDALRPNESGRSDIVDVGYPKGLRWTVTTETRIDTDAVRAEYEEAGMRPPETHNQKTTLRFASLPTEQSAGSS